MTTTTELERAAYAAGDTHTANLLARIDDLQRALGESVAENERLSDENGALDDMVRELREELDECLMAGMTPARGIGEVEFTFDHPNGDEIICHLEYDAGDPSESERMTLVGAYIGAVDVHGLLPHAIIDQIEAEALRDPS
jgi:hypothetical protein